jgi:hypothetical protein
MSLRASALAHHLVHWNPNCHYTNRVANEVAKNRQAEQEERGGNMSVTMLQSREVEETAEQKLWRAVIATTVEEWVSGPLRRKREAEKFLFDDNQDIQTVCFSAGINPENLRSRLEKIRSRQIADAQALASRN